MKKIIYKLSFALFTFINGALLAQNYYAKTIEKIGINTSASSSSKMAVSKNTIFVCGGQTTPVDINPSVASTTVPGSVYIRRITTSQQLLWAYAFNGPLTVNRLILDNNKSVYLVGNYNGAIDVDPGTGTVNVNNSGTSSTTDGVVIKLDSNGVYQWHQKIGNTGNDVANDIAFDPATNCVFVTGYFNGTFDFDPSPTAYNLTATNADMYVWRLNATTGSFFTAWANTGTSDQYGNTIVCDGSSNVIVSGSYYGTPDMDPSASTFTIAAASGADGFVVKYNQVGTLQWAKKFGGPTYGTSATKSLLIPGGNLIIAGTFTDLDIFYNGGYVVTNNSLLGTMNDIFYLSINPATGSLTAGFKLGGANDDNVTDISLDQFNNLIISGNALGTCNTNPVGTNTITFGASAYGTFFTKMIGTGVFDYTRTFGGGLSSASINNLLVNEFNEYLISGVFSWTGNLDPSPGVIQNYYAGNSNSNGFLINYAPCTSTVVASPVVTNTLTAICDGDYYIMTASSVGGGIKWYASSTSTTVLANGTSYNTNNPFTPAGVYSYYLTNNSGCGVSPQTVLNLTVSSIPTITLATSNNLLCVGQQATITASGATNFSLNSVPFSTSVVISPTTNTTYTIVGANIGCPVTAATITQSVSTCTGIEEAINNNFISVYPNPANDFISIDFSASERMDNITIYVVNTVGEIILIKKDILSNTTLQISNLPGGVYFIQVESGNGTTIKKFIKQ
ncbi:MAG: T9SS type A sorting domain-containing protein [Bacteroidia bacterium]|nr:T9SS type A sorting domain-containing protein [Bacteroidia bacterium]